MGLTYRQRTDWERYPACRICNVPPGMPCWVTIVGVNWRKNMTRPHAGRVIIRAVQKPSREYDHEVSVEGYGYAGS